MRSAAAHLAIVIKARPEAFLKGLKSSIRHLESRVAACDVVEGDHKDPGHALKAVSDVLCWLHGLDLLKLHTADHSAMHLLPLMSLDSPHDAPLEWTPRPHIAQHDRDSEAVSLAVRALLAIGTE